MDAFDESSDGEVLSAMSIYLLKRPILNEPSDDKGQPAIEEFEIRVLQYLNGEQTGSFEAAPYLFRYAEKAFIGKGRTKEDALRDALRRIKGVHFDRLFPSGSDGQSSFD